MVVQGANREKISKTPLNLLEICRKYTKLGDSEYSRSWCVTAKLKAEFWPGFEALISVENNL